MGARARRAREGGVMHKLVLTFTGVVVLSALTRGQPPGAGRGGGGFTHPEPIAVEDHAGWQSIFDGTLKNWDGDTTVWRVENNELIAEGTPQKRCRIRRRISSGEAVA